jgi:hypothetical protein
MVSPTNMPVTKKQVKLKKYLLTKTKSRFTHLKVNWQVDKIISSPVTFINSCQEHL